MSLRDLAAFLVSSKSTVAASSYRGNSSCVSDCSSSTDFLEEDDEKDLHDKEDNDEEDLLHESRLLASLILRPIVPVRASRACSFSAGASSTGLTARRSALRCLRAVL